MVSIMDASQPDASISNRIESFCRDHHVETLYVFGSRAGEINKAMHDDKLEEGLSSDVDIAVRLKEGRTLSVREKVGLAVELENLLGVDRIDLVVLPESDPFLAVNIIRGQRLFCRDDYEADNYELYVLRRAGDLARFERLRIAQIMDSPKL